jgi:3,4-dihydroxy-2-butanone 4-phosphate synthase
MSSGFPLHPTSERAVQPDRDVVHVRLTEPGHTELLLAKKAAAGVDLLRRKGHTSRSSPSPSWDN